MGHKNGMREFGGRGERMGEEGVTLGEENRESQVRELGEMGERLDDRDERMRWKGESVWQQCRNRL